MGLTHAELLERYTAPELAELEALYRSDPWGELRADWRAASTCYLLYRLCCIMGGKRPTLDVQAFLLSFGPAELPTPARLKEKILAINAALGGRVKKGRRPK
jgi:hypothetical protein